MSPQVTARAPTPNFPTPGLDYDRENESQFRLAVEQFMVEVARFPTDTSGLASHSLDFHDDVTVSSASQDDFLKHDGSEFVNVQHDRSLHDGLGTGVILYAGETWTQTAGATFNSNTVIGGSGTSRTLTFRKNTTSGFDVLGEILGNRSGNVVSKIRFRTGAAGENDGGILFQTTDDGVISNTFRMTHTGGCIAFGDMDVQGVLDAQSGIEVTGGDIDFGAGGFRWRGFTGAGDPSAIQAGDFWVRNTNNELVIAENASIGHVFSGVSEAL